MRDTQRKKKTLSRRHENGAAGGRGEYRGECAEKPSREEAVIGDTAHRTRWSGSSTFTDSCTQRTKPYTEGGWRRRSHPREPGVSLPDAGDRHLDRWRGGKDTMGRDTRMYAVCGCGMCAMQRRRRRMWLGFGRHTRRTNALQDQPTAETAAQRPTHAHAVLREPRKLAAQKPWHSPLWLCDNVSVPATPSGRFTGICPTPRSVPPSSLHMPPERGGDGQKKLGYSIQKKTKKKPRNKKAGLPTPAANAAAWTH